MYVYTWYQWMLFFFIYCFFGWIIESTYVSVKSRHLVNRGFLRLPLLPLYGSGAIIMLWAALPVKDNLLLVFLFGMIGASALEYVTGYAMERLFKMKYWDYSNNPFNINGYVCLGTSIAWGFLTIILMEVIHRPVERLVLNFDQLAEIVTVAVISVLFAADVVQSTKEALNLGRVLESMTKTKGELEELQLQLALLKAETVSRVSDLRDETLQKAFAIKGETAVKLVELKAETAARRNEKAAAFNEKVSFLTERLQSLTANREKLLEHLGFYRKGLLRGNPTASSKQFGEALRELKEHSQKRK